MAKRLPETHSIDALLCISVTEKAADLPLSADQVRGYASASAGSRFLSRASCVQPRSVETGGA
jgi:hypothetical protein